MDFVKSGCEKSWAEAACCVNGGKGAGELCQWLGTVDNKVGEDDERDARESSPQSGRRLRRGKVTGRRETGRKETRRKETGRKETGGKTTGAKERGVGKKGAKDSEGRTRE